MTLDAPRATTPASRGRQAAKPQTKPADRVPLTARHAARDEPVAANGHYTLHEGPAENVYDNWNTPDIIVSDGAYGVGGFPGDPRTPEGLEAWYAEHVTAWSKRAHPATTLWFWNTEIGWATVHPLLAREGWEYVQTILWDKGIGHVAGNVNGDTIRRLPTVTEVCAFYRRQLTFPTANGRLSAREWLRAEWRRTGMPLHRANEACGVKNAATRKYLTQDWLWYFPPADMMAKLIAYANKHGLPTGRPYYSMNGRTPITESEWAGATSPLAPRTRPHERLVAPAAERPGAVPGRRPSGRTTGSQPRKERNRAPEPEAPGVHAPHRQGRVERRRYHLGTVRWPVHGVSGGRRSRS